MKSKLYEKAINETFEQLLEEEFSIQIKLEENKQIIIEMFNQNIPLQTISQRLNIPFKYIQNYYQAYLNNSMKPKTNIKNRH